MRKAVRRTGLSGNVAGVDVKLAAAGDEHGVVLCHLLGAQLLCSNGAVRIGRGFCQL
jgi:hypothetical protein